MVGRLLRWARYKDVYHTYSNMASAIVYAHEDGYHWEVFVGDSVCWHGQVATLETAINHVEGNFIGHNLRSDLARQHPIPTTPPVQKKQPRVVLLRRRAFVSHSSSPESD